MTATRDPDTAGLPAVFSQLLQAVELRRRRLALLRALALALVVLVLALAVVIAVDLVAVTGIGLRRGLSLGAYLVAGSCLVVLVLRALLGRPDAAAIARRIEASGCARDEQLSAAVELARRPSTGVSRWMVDRTVALAANVAATVDPRRVIDDWPLRRSWAVAGALLGLVALGLLVPASRPFVLRAAVPGLDLVRPSTTRLSVEPAGNLRLARGSDLRVLARATPNPDRAILHIAWDDGVSEELPMVVDPEGRWVRTLRGLSQACRLRVRAGDAESRATRVEIDEPPRVQDLRLLVQPPAYTGLGERRFPGGDGEAPLGSEVTVTATLSGAAVRSAVLVSDGPDQQEERAMVLAGAAASATWRIDRPTTFGLRLVSNDGLEVAPSQRWRIAVHPDAEPRVAIDGGSGRVIAADETLVLRVTATDDLGLRGVSLHWRDPDGNRGQLPVPVEALTDISVERVVPLDLRRFDLGTGDRLVLYAEAQDRGGQVARSHQLEFQVTAADVASGAAVSDDLRQLLDQLRQQNQRWATWRSGWTGLRLAYRADDHALHRGTILVHRSGLGEIDRQLDTVADTLEGLDGGELLARHGHRLALACRAWTEHRLARVAQQLGPLDSSTAVADAAARVQRAEAAATQASRGLQDLVDWLQLLVAAHEAQVLDGRSQAGAARLGRSLELLRGRRSWLDPQVAGGLQVVFFRGDSLVGDPAHRATGIPRLENLTVPGIGNSGFAARWLGEVEIPEDGRWTVGATVDDGVRVTIDGQSVIGEEAWLAQAPTGYRGVIDLTAGWWPIEVEYFQGGGGSFLELWLERGDQRIPLDAEHLRHRVQGELLSGMLQLSPQQIERAITGTAQDLALLSQAPAEIDRLATEAPAPRLHGRVRELRGTVDELKRLRQTEIGEHGFMQLSAIQDQIRPVVELTTWARDELRMLLEEQAERHTPSEQRLGRLAVRAAELSRELDRLQHQRQDLERAGTLEEHLAGLEAEAQLMDRQLAAARNQARDAARDPASGPGLRLRNLDLEQGLVALTAERMPQLQADLQALAEDPSAVASARSVAQHLAQDLERLATVEAERDHARLAAAAGRSLAADDRVLAAARVDDPAAAALAALQRERATGDLAERLRLDGAGQTASELLAAEAAVGDRPLDDQTRHQLEQLAASDRAAIASADTQFADELGRLAETWDSSDARASSELQALPLRMDLGAERLRQEGQPDAAAGLGELAARTRRAAAHPQRTQRDELAALASDARDLAALAPAAADRPQDVLDQLAAGLESADPAQAALAHEQLQRLAASDLGNRLERAETALDVSDRLDRLRHDLELAAQEESAAVADFAASERELGQRMADLEPAGTGELDPALATRVAATRAALPQFAERAAGLAQRAAELARNEDSAPPTGPASGDLEDAAPSPAGDPAVGMAQATAAIAAAATAVASAGEDLAKSPEAGLAAGLQRAAEQSLAAAREAAAEARDILAATDDGAERPAQVAQVHQAATAAAANDQQQARVAERLAQSASELATGRGVAAELDPRVAEALSIEGQREADRLAELARSAPAADPLQAAAAAAQDRALAAHGELVAQLSQAPDSEQAAMRAGLQQRLSAAAASPAGADPERSAARQAAVETLRAAAANPQAERGAVDGGRRRLAQEALQLGGQLSDDLARPLAEAQSAALAAGTSSPAVAEFGQQLAGIAADQQMAAKRLQQAMRHRDALRQELAAELARSEALRAGGQPVPVPAPAQLAAERLQQAANQAWGEAAAADHGSQDSSSQQALASQQQATAAQAEALGIDPGMLAARQRQRAVDNLRQAEAAIGALPPSVGGAPTAAAAGALRQQLARATANQAAAARAASEALRAQADDLLAAGQPGASQAQAQAARTALGAAAAAPGEAAAARAAAAALAAAAAEQRLAALAAASGRTARQTPGSDPSQPGADPDQPATDGAGGEGSTADRQAGDLSGFDREVAGEDQAAWARLPERIRQTVRRGDWERFGEEHQAAIRAYFRALSEQE